MLFRMVSHEIFDKSLVKIARNARDLCFIEDSLNTLKALSAKKQHAWKFQRAFQLSLRVIASNTTWPVWNYIIISAEIISNSDFPLYHDEEIGRNSSGGHRYGDTPVTKCRWSRKLPTKAKRRSATGRSVPRTRQGRHNEDSIAAWKCLLIMPWLVIFLSFARNTPPSLREKQFSS